MNLVEYVLLALIVLTLAYFVIIYNHLVDLKHNVAKAWANIEVLLKQRHDELPKLVAVCKQYMQYEQATLAQVMHARAAVATAGRVGNIKALGQAEQDLRLGLGKLLAVAEAYPELKADEHFQHLQARVSALENAIADRREFYNESVNRNNIRIEQFPDLLIARAFGFKDFELLEFAAAQTADVDVKSLFD